MNLKEEAIPNNIVEMPVSILIFQQGDYYVAYCPSLELSSYGTSVEDAKVGFEDAMNIYLDQCAQARHVCNRPTLKYIYEY